MSNFKLSLPTDIPWERICVTEDMIDRAICDSRLPPKWQTSIAVFKYRPDDADQQYPKYWITYLKVTATITGYQPLDKEIQGQINWNGVNVETIPGLNELLSSYNPCHGAILQVMVGPTEDAGKVDPENYPFFMDFEPKKREMYELATDTKEKQSRSIESVNVTKSSGTTQSTEIFDIDMGGGGFGAQASYAGTGGGFTYTAPSGQWGTKRMNAEEGMTSRSADSGTEKRETYSFTTQISQMYHLLDSYHLGTNRAVFFVQPRPHTLEEPSGFVRGPRPVEGMQEFFMVVALPRKQKDFCVAVRLDTSHLTTIPIMDYDRKSVSTSIATANARVASKDDIPAEYIVGARACFGGCWNVYYQCYRTEAVDSVTYDAEPGYQIENYVDLINEASRGSTSVVVTPNRRTLNINVQAQGHICYEDSGVCVDCPDTIQEWAGHARRQVQVNLISTTPTKQVGEQQGLMITTRGLCCCASGRVVDPKFHDEYVTKITAIPAALAPVRYYRGGEGSTALGSLVFDSAAAQTGTRTIGAADSPHAAATASNVAHLCPQCAGNAATRQAQPAEPAAEAPTPRYTVRQANELSNYLRSETLKSLSDPLAKPEKFIETDFFAKQLEAVVSRTRKGRELLAQPAHKRFSKEAVSHLAKRLKKEPASVTMADMLTLQRSELAKLSGLDPKDVQRLKLASLGVAFKKGQDKPAGGKSDVK
ncbi:MAG: hypothetical protein OEU89_00140 [Burkholderiaceae bacterium]|nr:hypothetical protein [Burkholderiaceae bacterium]